MAGEEVEEPPLPVAGDLLEFDEIHRPPLVSAVSPLPKTRWSMVNIRNPQKNGSNDPPIVFPPIDHENLHISPNPTSNPDKIPYICAVNRRILFSDSDSDSDSNSSSTFSPSDSSPPPLSPLFPARTEADAAAGRLGSWSEILNSRVNYLMRLFCSVFNSSRGVFLTFRSAAFATVVVAFLYFRRRRRLRGGERSRLVGVIKERDEVVCCVSMFANMLLCFLTKYQSFLNKVSVSYEDWFDWKLFCRKSINYWIRYREWIRCWFHSIKFPLLSGNTKTRANSNLWWTLFFQNIYIMYMDYHCYVYALLLFKR